MFSLFYNVPADIIIHHPVTFWSTVDHMYDGAIDYDGEKKNSRDDFVKDK